MYCFCSTRHWGGDLHYAAYSEQNRYAVAPGVNYQSQVGSLSSGGSGSGGFSSPMPSAYVSEAYKSGMLGGSAYTSSTGLNTGSNSFNSGSGIGFQNSRSSKNGQAGGAAGSGFALAGVGKKTSTEISNQSSIGGGFGGSLNATSNSTGGVMQRGAAEEEDPLDPGGDPIGGPLPLNGEWILLILGAGYFALKALKKQH